MAKKMIKVEVTGKDGKPPTDSEKLEAAKKAVVTNFKKQLSEALKKKLGGR